MSHFHLVVEDISYTSDPELDGHEANAREIAALNQQATADDLFGDGILKLISARIAEDDEQEGNEERKVFVSLTFLVEADDSDEAENLMPKDELLDLICESFLDDSVNSVREQNWEVLSADDPE